MKNSMPLAASGVPNGAKTVNGVAFFSAPTRQRLLKSGPIANQFERCWACCVVDGALHRVANNLRCLA